MIEAEKGQYYFEVQGENFVYEQKFIGLENQSLVPGIVAGRDKPSWQRTILLFGVLGGTTLPGALFLDQKGGMFAFMAGSILTIVTSKIYDHFSKIRHLSQRRVEKQLLIC